MKYYLNYNALTSEGLIDISCNNRQLFINHSIINFENDINGVSIGLSIVFVLFLGESSSYEELPKNNVHAYDFNGNFLWDIGEVVDEARPFQRMSIHNAKSLIQHDTSSAPLAVTEGHEYLVLYTCGDQRFIIDVTEKRQIQKKGGFR